MSPYQILLNTPEWYIKREALLIKNKYRCERCFNQKLIHNSKPCVTILNQLLADGRKLVTTIYKDRMVKIIDSQEVNENFLYFVDLEIPIANEYISYSAKINSKKINEFRKAYKNERLSNFNSWVYVKGLHIHHTYYQYGRQPWEYSEDSLNVLCADCHKNTHEETNIPIYDERGNVVLNKKLIVCPKCNGTGVLPKYKHVENGICFQCMGARYVDSGN